VLKFDASGSLRLNEVTIKYFERLQIKFVCAVEHLEEFFLDLEVKRCM
jgi:hypothetical protein